MNLADAIRRAASASGAPLGQPEPHTEETFFESAPVARVVSAAPEEEVAMSNEGKHRDHEGEYGNIVRLELVLTPEQLKGLFGAVVANQHSVMTLKEAANHLRVSPKALEELANSGEVPGMLVDGRWRFTRQGLDDWLNTSARQKKGA